MFNKCIKQRNAIIIPPPRLYRWLLRSPVYLHSIPKSVGLKFLQARHNRACTAWGSGLVIYISTFPFYMRISTQAWEYRYVYRASWNVKQQTRAVFAVTRWPNSLYRLFLRTNLVYSVFWNGVPVAEWVCRPLHGMGELLAPIRLGAGMGFLVLVYTRSPLLPKYWWQLPQKGSLHSPRLLKHLSTPAEWERIIKME